MRVIPALGVLAFGLTLPTLALAQASPPAGRTPAPAAGAPVNPSAAVPPTNPATPDLPSTSASPPATATPPAATPDATAGATAAPDATASAAAPAPTVTAGLAVKDKTGASIGQVAQVKTEANGKQTATIKMGAESFAVDTAALAVDQSGATINATQAEIRAMMKKK